MLGDICCLVVFLLRQCFLDFLQCQQVVAHVGERVFAQDFREFDGLARVLRRGHRARRGLCGLSLMPHVHGGVVLLGLGVRGGQADAGGQYDA